MEEILEEGFGTLAVVLLGLTCVIYFLKRINFSEFKLLEFMTKKLRKYHKVFGFAFIAIGTIHGYSTGKLLTLNLGTLAIIASILLYLSFCLRKLLKKYWMISHRVLSIILVILVGLHILIEG